MNKPKTIADLESGSSAGPALITTDSFGNLLCRAGNTTWSLNVVLWTGLMVVANILHPPVIIMLVLNAALMLLTMNSVRLAGTRNTPPWIYVIIALQGLVTLQYAGYVLQGIF